MEWEMKMASWDIAELERDSEPNIGSVISASTGKFGSQLVCSVDLKLGRLGDFKPPNKSKRARAITNGSQKAVCLVDGCKSDLSGCREYHRRHKVCEAHSKTPTVMVGGQEQRFCQQCSRFHLLGEFDDVKRSCRKRLDGHNRRRRKPQPEAIHASSLLPHLQGPMFSSYHMCQTSAPAYSTWCPTAKLEEDSLHKFQYPHFFDRCQHFDITNSHNYEDMKRFPFLQNISTSVTSGMTLETSACQPLLNTISFSQNRMNNSKIYSDGLTHVLDSDCVLSLLSSPTQTHGVKLSCTVPTERVPIAQTMSQSLHHLGRYSRSQSSTTVSVTGFPCSALDDEQVSDILVPDAELQSSGLFQVGGDGSSDGPSNVLPFSW